MYASVELGEVVQQHQRVQRVDQRQLIAAARGAVVGPWDEHGEG